VEGVRPEMLRESSVRIEALLPLCVRLIFECISNACNLIALDVKSSSERQKHTAESVAPAKAEKSLHGHAGFPRSF